MDLNIFKTLTYMKTGTALPFVADLSWPWIVPNGGKLPRFPLGPLAAFGPPDGHLRPRPRRQISMRDDDAT